MGDAINQITSFSPEWWAAWESEAEAALGGPVQFEAGRWVRQTSDGIKPSEKQTHFCGYCGLGFSSCWAMHAHEDRCHAREKRVGNLTRR